MKELTLKKDALKEFPENVTNFCFICFDSKSMYFKVDQYNSLSIVCNSCGETTSFCEEFLPDFLLVEK